MEPALLETLVLWLTQIAQIHVMQISSQLCFNANALTPDPVVCAPGGSVDDVDNTGLKLSLCTATCDGVKTTILGRFNNPCGARGALAKGLLKTFSAEELEAIACATVGKPGVSQFLTTFSKKYCMPPECIQYCSRSD